MENRLIELEIKLSYAEDLLEELNRVVVRQQAQIDQLGQQVILLSQQFREMAPAEGENPRDQIPPHY